eukprot:UN15427
MNRYDLEEDSCILTVIKGIPNLILTSFWQTPLQPIKLYETGNFLKFKSTSYIESEILYDISVAWIGMF